MLEDLGLNDTLKWLCEDFALLNRIQCRYHTNYDVALLPHEIQLDFFRICQEALSNVTLHAQATFVKVSIDSVEENIYLSIEDDGIGFVPEQVTRSSGLTNMKTRAASINGQLTIDSAPGKGTQVSLSVRQPFNYD
jgi:signal transduction histidine kinase